MDLKQQMLKLNWLKGKDKWLFLLAVGLILLILAFPDGGPGSGKEEVTGQEAALTVEEGGTAEVAARPVKTYEEQMEERVKEILSHVEGVGKVDVMIVLKSSEEKVLRVDTNSSLSSTRETDSSGGSRNIENQEVSESTILTGNGEGPIVEKELKPEVSGVVISAEGGESPKVKADISEAMEALFDIPAHKIKVLKRVG